MCAAAQFVVRLSPGLQNQASAARAWPLLSQPPQGLTFLCGNMRYNLDVLLCMLSKVEDAVY